jgi:hypothetical protein
MHMQEGTVTEGVAGSCGSAIADGGRLLDLVIDGYLAEAWNEARVSFGPCWAALRETAATLLPTLGG